MSDMQNIHRITLIDDEVGLILPKNDHAIFMKYNINNTSIKFTNCKRQNTYILHVVYDNYIRDIIRIHTDDNTYADVKILSTARAMYITKLDIIPYIIDTYIPKIHTEDELLFPIEV